MGFRVLRVRQVDIVVGDGTVDIVAMSIGQWLFAIGHRPVHAVTFVYVFVLIAQVMLVVVVMVRYGLAGGGGGVSVDRRGPPRGRQLIAIALK